MINNNPSNLQSVQSSTHSSAKIHSSAIHTCITSIRVSPALLEKIRAGRTTQLRLVDNVPSGEEGLANLMKQCLTEYPADRPTFQKIKVIISQQAR